jgi:hypothetical protein
MRPIVRAGSTVWRGLPHGHPAGARSPEWEFTSTFVGILAEPRSALCLVKRDPRGYESGVPDPVDFPPVDVFTLFGDDLSGDDLSGDDLSGDAVDGEGVGLAVASLGVDDDVSVAAEERSESGEGVAAASVPSDDLLELPLRLSVL